MRGLVNDLKAVTSGQWLRDETSIEGFATAFATLLVYMSAALASNASAVGSLIIAGLLLVSIALLGLCNFMTAKLQRFGRIVYKEGELKRYTRRIDMAKEFVASSGEMTGLLGWVKPMQSVFKHIPSSSLFSSFETFIARSHFFMHLNASLHNVASLDLMRLVK